MSEVGVAGDGCVGEAGSTGPGGGGWGLVAVVLCVPGKTMASESWMLGFVFVSMFPLSAKDLCRASCQCQIQARVIVGAVPGEYSCQGAFRAIESWILAQMVFEELAGQKAEPGETL